MNKCGDEREVGLVLPVGCGKSGLITLTPFAFKARRALVVAPGVKITATNNSETYTGVRIDPSAHRSGHPQHRDGRVRARLPHPWHQPCGAGALRARTAGEGNAGRERYPPTDTEHPKEPHHTMSERRHAIPTEAS